MKNMNLALSNYHEHVNPLVIVLAPFGKLEKLTNTLKKNKSRDPKSKKCIEEKIKRQKIMQVQRRRGSHNTWVASQEALCLMLLARLPCNVLLLDWKNN